MRKTNLEKQKNNSNLENLQVKLEKLFFQIKL